MQSGKGCVRLRDALKCISGKAVCEVRKMMYITLRATRSAREHARHCEFWPVGHIYLTGHRF